MQLPSDAGVQFILCEAAREEKGGKITLLGVYPDRKLLLPPETKFPVPMQLAFVFFLLDGEGPFNGTLSVNTPNGEPMLTDAALPNILKTPDSAGTIVIGVAPFPIIGFGRNEAVLALDGQQYHRYFFAVAAPPGTVFS